jgi:ribose transport system ATP-binding protein
MATPHLLFAAAERFRADTSRSTVVGNESNALSGSAKNSKTACSPIDRVNAFRARAQPWIWGQFRTRYADYDDAITSLSGGNQQKVMIARCLGRASKLIVLEDPTAGVDIGSKQDIHELVRDRAAAGSAVFLISSDLLETIAICDVIYTVIGGQIVRKYDHPSMEDEASIIADVLGA